MNFNEIFRKNVAYDNLKNYNRTELYCFSRKYIFGKHMEVQLLLTIIAKLFIVDVCGGFGYTSARFTREFHCVKSVSCLYFPAFGLNTERYGVSFRIQSEYGKIRIRKTSNTDTFQTRVHQI